MPELAKVVAFAPERVAPLEVHAERDHAIVIAVADVHGAQPTHHGPSHVAQRRRVAELDRTVALLAANAGEVRAVGEAQLLHAVVGLLAHVDLVPHAAHAARPRELARAVAAVAAARPTPPVIPLQPPPLVPEMLEPPPLVQPASPGAYASFSFVSVYSS